MRKLIALTVAGWMLALAPCAALALCLGPQAASCCCQKADSCCCRDSQQRAPAAPPALPNVKATPEHAATAVAIAPVIALPTPVDALVSAAEVAALVSAPTYLTSCALRC